ncbi:MAG: flagellar assembly protein FliW [Deltaproteobacteria bacterium]|nr:MAG: flagellar assembly protein FliW [Deltaproteobacteria bacterium]PIE75011.1 MAG: flagellar assembly protein FliW [Deltaproteobacteria bacterium]
MEEELSNTKIKIETTRFGDIEIPKEKIYTFPDGIPGFPSCKSYCILDNDKNALFKWLQSADSPELAFVLFDPFLITSDYDVFIDDDELKILQADKKEDLIVTVILTIPKNNHKKMTANLKAPIVFNIRKKIGKQIILNDSDYPLEFPVMKALSNQSQ